MQFKNDSYGLSGLKVKLLFPVYISVEVVVVLLFISGLKLSKIYITK